MPEDITKIIMSTIFACKEWISDVHRGKERKNGDQKTQRHKIFAIF